MFSLFFEQSRDAIWLFDPQSNRFVDCNQAAAELLGYQSKQRLLDSSVLGLSAELQADGRRSAEAAPLFSAQVERNGTNRFDWVARRQDGTDIPLEIVATRIRTGTGSLHVLVSRDMRERRKIEAELRTSEQRWRLLFEQSPLSIQIFGPDGKSRRVNRAWERLFNGTQEDLANFNVLEDPQLTAGGVIPLVRRAFAGESVHVPPVPFEIQLHPNEPSRGIRWIGALMFPLLDLAGRPTEIVCVHEDFTESKRAQEQAADLNAALERRVAERTAELRASEDRLRTLVEHAPEAIVVFDATGCCFLNCNENALRLFGLTREELLRVGPPDVSPDVQPDGRSSKEAARAWISLAEKGGTPVFQWVHKHKDGRLIPCEVRLVRLPADGKHLIRGSIIDNTERRRKELIQTATYQISEAVQSTADLQSLFTRIHEVVMTFMPARNFYIALYDPSTNTFTFPYFVDQRDPQPGPMQLSRGLTGTVLRTGKALLVNSQTPIRKLPQGLAALGPETVYTESGTPSAVWLGAPLLARGQCLGVIAVQDYENDRAYGEEEKQLLTYVAEQTAVALERKRADQALKESEARFRGLFEATSQGAVLHSREHIIAVNPAALRMLGYETPQRILGKHLADLSAPVQQGGVSALELAGRYFLTALKEGHAHFEWLARRSGGAEFPAEVFLTTIESEGQPLIQVVINDITDRKKVEAELLRGLAREKELGELKSNFVSLVSHEFRTPLGIIMSSAEILRDYLPRLDEQERYEHLNSIQKSARRMADLMEEALLLGRFEAGRMDFKPKAVNLSVLTDRIVREVFSATGQRCPVHLQVAVDARQAVADERLLRHIFSNLLSNAIKYSSEGRPVAFEIRREAGDALCTFRDQGIGIPEDDREWLFRAFHRGRNATDRPGTGLGLVIVKRCVELHGGDIDVVSAVGQGSTFTVRLPIFNSVPEEPTQPTAPPCPSRETE